MIVDDDTRNGLAVEALLTANGWHARHVNGGIGAISQLPGCQPVVGSRDRTGCRRGMYTASVGATVIILVILVGIKPIERRFIAVRQQRNVQLLVERDAYRWRHCTLCWEAAVCA
ncbi:hypothetical protein KZJ38_07220 [Paraburkholderia edwinii]|uniref:Response regulator receiver domain-containing protein n=1 Tax=Paraburkholderia edwinii TaxID=2861782 RepID=A0ABX8UM82_9BURK|nr:hypothetical protein KZJ38_07220 [Paraburkholderia edwinii]